MLKKEIKFRSPREIIHGNLRIHRRPQRTESLKSLHNNYDFSERLENIEKNLKTSGWTKRIADSLTKVEEMSRNMGLGHLYEEQIRKLRESQINSKEINQLSEVE